MGPSEDEAPVLNPFPFATETNFRLAFLMLVAGVVALSAGYMALAALLATTGGEACAGAAALAVLPAYDSISAIEMSDFLRFMESVEVCTADVPGGSLVFWPLAFVAALAAATALGIAASVWLIVRRNRLRPPPEAVRSILDPRIAALSDALGLRDRRPILHWMALEARPRAFVFGSDRRPRLAVSYGAVAEGFARPDALDTLLAHELAHIVNRDLSAATAGRAVTAALLWVILPLYLVLTQLLPWVLGPHPEALPGVGGYGATINEFMRIGAAVALIHGSRNAVLRARERFADLRAAQTPGIREGLDARFRLVREPPAWRRILDPHPASAARRRGLVSTDDLFRPETATAVAFGFALTLGALVAMLVSSVLLGPAMAQAVANDQIVRFCLLVFAPLSLLAALFSCALSPITWRAGFADALLARRPTSALRPAIGAAAGATLGIFGSVAGGAFLQGQAFEYGWIRGGAASRIPTTLFVFGLFLLVFGSHFAWARRTALAWSGRLARRPWGGRAVLPLALLTALPLAILAPPVLLVAFLTIVISDLGASSGQSVLALAPAAALGIAGSLLFHPLAPVALAIICALPLSAAAVRGGAVAAWPTLRGRLPASAEPPLRPLRAAAIGAAVGLTTWLALRTGLFRSLTVNAQIESANMLLAVSAALGLAGLAAAFAPAFRFEHGLLAVAVAGLVACGLLMVAAFDLDLEAAWFLVSWSFAAGVAVAGVGSVLGAVSARLLRPHRRRQAGPEPSA